MISPRRILKNTTFLTVAFVTRKVIHLVAFSLIARYTGVQTTGLYFLLLSFAALFTSLMDFGLTPAMIREASKAPERLHDYLGNVLGLKVFLCVAASAAGFGLIHLLDYPDLTQRLVYLTTIYIVLDSLADTFYGCLRVHHRMEFEAKGMVVSHFLILLISSFVVFFQLNIYGLVFALIMGGLYNLIYSLFCTLRVLHLKLNLYFDHSVVKQLVSIAIPILGAAAFSKLLFIDTFLLSYLTDETVLGWFSVPSTLVQSFMFIPMAVTMAIYPALSSFHIHSPERLIETFERSVQILMIFIIPAAIGMAVLAPGIIRFFFGISYGPSVLPFRILTFSLIPIFFNGPMSVLLDACHRQVSNSFLMAVAAILHLGLALTFIPNYQAVGIAWAAVFGHTAFFVLGIFAVRGILAGALKRCLTDMAVIFVAAGLMGLAVFSLRNIFHFIVLIPVGIAAYAVLFFLITRLAKRYLGRKTFHFIGSPFMRMPPKKGEDLVECRTP
ncbi:MAG: flippase [Deltaproteobacteria bacterium]|nr:flippase [Deltaproteobacteria bacterium]